MNGQWKGYFAHVALLGCLLFVSLTLTSCTEQSSSDIAIDNGEFKLSPRAFFTQRNVNVYAGDIFPIIKIDGTEISTNRSGDAWVAQSTVASGDSVYIQVDWYENYQQRSEIQLASWSSVETISQDQNISLSIDDYETDQFDFDRDGDSNMVERLNQTNPLDILSHQRSLPTENINVIVPHTSDSRSPVIDGRYRAQEYEQQSAQFNDLNSNPLKIDNLMLVEGTTGVPASRSDGNTEFKWFTIYDDDFLYIGVLGENVSLATRQSDSVNDWDDDSLDIYIDVNNDKLPAYGIDDYHFLIPLQTLSGEVNRNGANGRISLGSDSAFFNLSDIEFSTCDCRSGQYFYEVRIPLRTFNLQPRVPFGIEVQLNIDHDGGDRDIKWGWYHPSGSDIGWRDPQTFGTAVLQ